MEVTLQGANEIPDPTKSSKSFMFNEEKISKQLIDMKEQTDFMKRFRCALGIALREIKTLRTATENGNELDDATSSCQSSKGVQHFDETEKLKTSQFSDDGHNRQCVCGDFANSDLRILKKYLNEMDETGEMEKKPDPFSLKVPKHMEKLKQESRTLIEQSIAHIERLKGRVENRNALIKKLCQQLSLARLIRVRRETKLEEKLQQISVLKAENMKMRRSYDKQVIIARSLRGALNSQKQKIESSENMLQRLDETRKAFDSLKSQASYLMKSLHDKDNEIAELNSKLARKESTQTHVSPHNRSDVDASFTGNHPPLVAQIDQRNDTKRCVNCERKANELESMKLNYHKLYDDFEYYRRNHPKYLAPESTQPSRDYDQSHPYNRRRMHAPYASPESYRRVSRPPLRRRLNLGQYSNDSAGTRTNNFVNMGDTLLSPIDEFVENPEETGQETAHNGEHVSTPVSNSNQHGVMQYRNEQTGEFVADFKQTQQNDTVAKFHTGISAQYHQIPSSCTQRCEQSVRDSSEASTPQKEPTASSAKTSYLELGNRTSPSLSASSRFGIETEPESPLRMNSFIRQQEPDGFEGQIQSDDIVDLPQQPATLPEHFNPSFGVIWHPALKERAARLPSTPETATTDELQLEKLDIAQNPARIQLFGSNNGDNSHSNHQEAHGKNRSHYVTYKGHEIDVTNFSIHEFRDIIWSLDGGQESANAFIKFLSSTAKKLNASPKWAGKHTMGNPDDWLALRGLY